MRLLDAASVAGFGALSAALAMRVCSVPWYTGHLVSILGGLGLGYVLADIVSGVVHWFCDTFFEEDTPIIGRAFIHPFREHHDDPLSITRHDFFEVNGNNCLALVPLLVAVLLFGRPAGGEPVPALFAQSLALGFAVATFATNQIHKWAHQERPAAVVRRLQAIGLILSPQHHAEHHRSPYRQAYCITGGWLDGMLDRSRVFERIENAVRRAPAGGRRRADSNATLGAAARRRPIARASGH